MRILTPSVISGSPDDIGYRLGELARPVMHAYMQQSAAWQRVSRWRGHPFVKALRDAAEAHFPALVAELEGMAAGLGWPVGRRVSVELPWRTDPQRAGRLHDARGGFGQRAFHRT